MNTPYFSTFYTFRWTRCRGKNKSRGTRKNNKYFVNCKNAETLIDTIENLYSSHNVAGLYALLRNSSVKLIEKAIACTETFECKFNETKCFLQAYNSQYVLVKSSQPEKKAFLKIELQHKSFEDLRVNSIPKSSIVRESLPEAAKHIKICTTYTYLKPLVEKF